MMGTGVKVGISVNVGIGMYVAAGLGVQVGGRDNGEEVCGGLAFVIELPQADNKMISNEAINNNFLLIE
jgi:hypothetical protein